MLEVDKPNAKSNNADSLRDALSLHPTPVLAEVLDEIALLIDHYFLLPHPFISILIACWVAQTYCFERFEYCGYLAFRSATPRCGKSRLLKLVAMLSKEKPPVFEQPTAAVLFRANQAVIVMDEVDRLRDADRQSYGDVISILNAGFERSGVVPRTERTPEGEFRVKLHPVYGPKAIAGLESLAETLADRVFLIQMRRRRQRGPRCNFRRLGVQAEQIREALSNWTLKHGGKVQAHYESLPDEIPELSGYDDRFQDIAEPLFVLAKMADSERCGVPQILPRLIGALAAVAGHRERSSREVELLAFLDIVRAVLDSSSEYFIRSKDLLDRIGQVDPLAWIKSEKSLASFLANFELHPRQSPDGKARGYHLTREWVTELERAYR